MLMGSRSIRAKPGPTLGAVTFGGFRLRVVLRGERHATRLVHGGRLDVEGVGESNEEVEQGGVVGGLGDLLVGPAVVTQLLHLFVRDLVSRAGDRGYELEEQTLALVKSGRVQVSIT